MLKEGYLFAKTDSGPIETFTEDVVAWVILCLYLNICIQSILYTGPKIYNDIPMKFKSLNNYESFKYKYLY